MSANTNADVAAMVTRLEVVIGECLLGLASHKAAGTCRSAISFLQSQQAEITRLSAMVEERTKALKGTVNALDILRQYRLFVINSIGADGDAIRSAEQCFNKAFEAAKVARQAISTQEPTP